MVAAMVAALAIGGWDDPKDEVEPIRLAVETLAVGSVEDARPTLSGMVPRTQLGELTYASDSFTRGWADLGPTATPTAMAHVQAIRTPEVDWGALSERAALVSVPRSSEASAGLEQLICAYPWPCDWAVAVILCENGGAWEGFDEATGVTYWGGWQLALSHGFPGLVGASPALQTEYAWTLYQDGGAAHWPSCP